MGEERPIIRETEIAIADALARPPLWEIEFKYPDKNAAVEALPAFSRIAFRHQAAASLFRKGSEWFVVIRSWRRELTEELEQLLNQANAGGTRVNKSP